MRIGVNGAKKPRDRERFMNLRAEMYDGLRQRFCGWGYFDTG